MERVRVFLLLFLAGTICLSGQTNSTSPTITGISNSASGTAAIESGSWVSIYGTNLATTTRSWQAADIVGGALPTTLDNVTVSIDGKPAAIAYVSSGQLNVQAPADANTGSVPVVVTNLNGTVTGTATLQAYSPGFFTFQAKYAAALHNSDGVAVAPNGFLSGMPSRPAVPGESIQVYATGLGPTTPAIAPGQTVAAPAPLSNPGQLTVTVGGAPAQVQYAGMVAPGEYQINLVVPPESDGDQLIVASIGGAQSQASVYLPVQNSVTGTVTVTVTPNNRTILAGATQAFSAKVSNTSNPAVTWQVNGITGGNPTVGTITTAGVYTAPAVLPNPASITITAISQEQASAQASVTLHLQYGVPVVTAVSPNPLNPGNATVTVTGTGFAPGATLYVAGAALPTTVVSGTQITATAALTMPVGRLASVKVTNPSPGGSTSTPLTVPVRVANEMIDYADAVRFLRMTTWGPTPQNVADLQAMGTQAWLAAQFAQPPSAWPDPNTTNENVSRLQTAFWNVALTGSDQLRQRAALALAEIMVVSAVQDGTFEQMVGYQRTMGQYAFDTYRNLLNAVTLNPAMGDYLNMVNNVKATGTTSPNENFARETMQLFTLGLVQLDSNGNPIIVNGDTVPEYDQTAVATMARIMTGWTYGETPGFGSIWPNMPYYFGPMIPFEKYHDTDAKTLNLPIPCTIAAGGTAESDLSAAYDCIFQQTNIAPALAFRLIQHFVKSSPSPDYVGRVASAYLMAGGSLQSTITAILSDPEATAPGTGKLTEPILYVTNLLRALNAKITSPDGLTGQATAMGQTPLSPPTVFSFFSPAYVIPNLTPTTLAPEFQTLNAATALARANFAWRAVNNNLSSGIAVDFSNLVDVAGNPADLVEAINQALFAGQMDSNMRTILTTAAGASSNLAQRVRSVLYAAAASPQYSVQQ